MNIIKSYKQDEYTYTIEQAANGTYWNEYGASANCPCSAGPFATLAEAKEMMKRHRPNAIEI